MTKKIEFDSTFIDAFLGLSSFFDKHHLRYCLIGGIAAGFWGEPRYTKDMDFTVVSHERDIKSLIKLIEKEKYEYEPKGESQVQIIKKGKASFIADLILADTDYQDWVVQRAISVNIFGNQIPICTPEDLIILKAIAKRRQDLLDIENVLKKNNDLDFDYIDKWLTFWEVKDFFYKEFKDTLKA